MLSLHRRYLVHKIWKARAVHIGSEISAKTFGILKEAVFNFLADLRLGALVRLSKILADTRTGKGECFYANSRPNSGLFVGDSTRPQRERFLISKVWRWPELKEVDEVRHVGCEDMGDCLCVNPFHFSRIVKRGNDMFGVYFTRVIRSHSCVVGDSEALLVYVRRWVTIYENLYVLSLSS